jgi:hypothetical protein
MVYTLLRGWGTLPNGDWAGRIALMPLLLLFFPWALARVRGIGKLKPLKRRLPVWAALPLALLVFIALGVFGTMLVWSNAGAMSQFCPPGMREPRYQSFLILMVNIPVSSLRVWRTGQCDGKESTLPVTATLVMPSAAPCQSTPPARIPRRPRWVMALELANK